ncbi:MAG: slipin family protein [Ruminococcaceae bacterium]|nr:slipin family protein [Oscillospiraceae bacterium]
MKKVIINQNQKGLLFKNGKYEKLLNAGKYYIGGGKRVEVLEETDRIASKMCGLDILLTDQTIADSVTLLEVANTELALHFVNDQFEGVLRRGRYAFWNSAGEHTFQKVDITNPEVSADIPEYVFEKIPALYYQKVEVEYYQKALLYINNNLIKVLDAGTYYYWRGAASVKVSYVDTRLTQMDITGQEILTLDKVPLRINFVCNYRVTDCEKLLTEIDDFAEQMYVTAQLALREYVGKYKLDEILEGKQQMCEFVLSVLKSKEKELFVEVKNAGIKDIILPGEIREIMKTVLMAEKKAQANVITRREEVASTRSLLNTAKLMDENKTLYKLKELEYIERICENINNLNLNGNTDILTQLTNVLRGS